MAKSGKRKTAPGDVATNRQARHRFEILETFEAGIELRGTEVKALREGRAQITDAYATIDRGELILHNLHIPPYAPASRENHLPERPRRLLLHRREIEKLQVQTKEKGLTIVPLRLYFKGSWAKVEIALAKGRDRHDKRQAIKEREMKREMERAVG